MDYRRSGESGGSGVHNCLGHLYGIYLSDYPLVSNYLHRGKMPDAYCPMRACLIGGCAVAFGTTTVGALLGGGFGVPGQMRMAWHVCDIWEGSVCAR